MINKIKGFVIIELVIISAILAVLGAATITVINPSKIIKQTKDAQRKSDLNVIRTALESYNVSHNCYSTSVPFGQAWNEGSMVYNKLVPQDPNYPASSYLYVTDGSNCPIWYVLFAKLSILPSTPACKLPENCLPINYNSNWGCLINGQYDCSIIITQSLPAEPTSAPGILASLGSLFTGTSSVSISPGSTSPLLLLTPTATPSATVSGLPSSTANSKFVQAGDGTWCYDSDGTSTSTINKTTEYNTEGFCIDKAGTHYDFCSGDLARSYYCGISSGSSGTSNASCDLGGYYCNDPNTALSPVCVSGACSMTILPTPISAGQPPASTTFSGSDGTYCYDSDGNGNAGVAGSCQDNTGIYNDFCPSGKTLVDYYCSGKWNGQTYFQVKCSGGTQNCNGMFDIKTGVEYSCRSGICAIFNP